MPRPTRRRGRAFVISEDHGRWYLREADTVTGDPIGSPLAQVDSPSEAMGQAVVVAGSADKIDFVIGPSEIDGLAASFKINVTTKPDVVESNRRRLMNCLKGNRRV